MPASDDLLFELLEGTNGEVGQPASRHYENATDISPTNETVRPLVEAPTQSSSTAPEDDLHHRPTFMYQTMSYIAKDVDPGGSRSAQERDCRHVRLPQQAWMPAFGKGIEQAKKFSPIRDLDELVGIECGDGVGPFRERPSRQFVEPIGLAQGPVLSANDGDGEPLVAKRMKYPLAAIATAMGCDVEMVEKLNIVANERFESVFLVANHCYSKKTHCRLSSEVEDSNLSWQYLHWDLR